MIEVELPDGGIAEFPDGTSPDAIKSALGKRFQAQGQQAAPQQKKPESFWETISKIPSLTDRSPEAIAADPLARFAVGAARPVAGALQFTSEGAKNNVNPFYRLYGMVAAPGFNEIASRVKQTERIGKAGLDQGVGGWNVAGTVGELMSPLGLYANKGLNAANSVLQRILSGSIFGGGTAVAQPSEKTGEEFNSDKLAELIIGTAGGAAVAGAMEVPRFAVKLVRDYFTQAGAKDMSMDYIDKILGGKENTDKLVSSIEAKLQSQGKGPVPDYRATTGEMVATNPLSSPLLALQKRTSEMPGGISADWGARTAGNQSALRSALGTISGAPGDMIAALNTAQSNAAANYGPLMSKVVPVSQQEAFIFSTPSMKDAVQYARNLAAERGYSFPKSLSGDMSVQNLHDIKLGLDAGIRSGSMRDPVTGASSLDNSTLAAMTGTKNSFLKWMESKVPEYGQARTQFASDMTPVNQMRVGQSLLEKLTMPTGKESPGSFLRALSDEAKLIKSSTGQPRGELDKILNPRQMETVNEVGSILENKLASLSPIQKTNLGGRAAGADAGLQLPSILSRPVVVANYLLSLVHKGDSPVEQRVNKIMSEWMLNPDKFAAAVKTMRAADQESLFRMLSDAGIDPVRTGMIAPAASFLTEQNVPQ